MFALFQRNTLKDVTIALLLTLAATALRQSTVPLFALNGSPLFHVFAIGAAAQYAGLTAGLLTTILSLGALAGLSSQPQDYVSLALIAAFGVVVSLDGERRRTAQRELRRVHDNLETAQQLAKIGSWESDLTGNIWWSPETYSIFGVAPGTKLRLDDFVERVHPEDRELVRQAVQRSVSSGAAYDVEHRIVRQSDGEIRHVHQRAKIARDGSPHLIGSIQDVTDALVTHRALARAYDRLSIKHEVGRIGTFEWFVQENCVEWSPEMEAIYGISSDVHQHTFEEWRALVHPDDVDAALAAIDDAVAKRLPSLDSTYRIVRPDGVVVWIHSRGKYEYGADGRPLHMLGVNMDVTELKRATDEAERVNRTMELALEAGNSGAWSWKVGTRELVWSDAYCRLLGVEPGTPPSPELFYSRIHPEDVERVRRDVEEALEGRKDEFLIEFRIVRPDGLRWIERRGRVFRGRDGRPVELVGISTDITERKILRGLLPTCAQCKKIRDEHDHWHAFEVYVSDHSNARFSHGLCPDCLSHWEKVEGLGS